jgi:ribonuclease P protein component
MLLTADHSNPLPQNLKIYSIRMRHYTLGKNERLKSRKLIEKLFSERKSFAVPPFRVHFMLGSTLLNAQDSTINVQCGFSATTRNFKKAVDRNRIKRLTREAWRLQKQALVTVAKEKQQQLAVFLVYTAKELPAFDVVKKKVEIIISKLIAIVNETTIKAS